MLTFEKKVDYMLNISPLRPRFIDVYGIDKNRRMVVIEIKRKTAGKEAALQLARYVESVKSMMNREIRGLLVAPQVSKGVQKLLISLGLEYKQIDPKKCAEILRRVKTKKIMEFF